MKLKQNLKSHLQINAAWPFAAVLLFLSEYGRPIFRNEGVAQFLVSPMYLAVMLVSIGFITYLFLEGYVSYHKKFKNWIKPERRRSWRAQVAIGSAAFLTTEIVSIFGFFICLFMFADGRESPELDFWLIVDFVIGVMILPIYNY